MAAIKPVLFSSDRPLERAENLKAVWDAYDGEKEFVRYIPNACMALSSKYSVFVCDCTPQYSPNKGDVKTIFVGHGVLCDKLYGLDCNESHRKGVEQVDYAVTPEGLPREHTATALGMPIERVLPLGFPMADKYHGKRKGDGDTVLSAVRRAYLYVPTWRPKSTPPLPRIDWAKLDAMMDDDEIIVVKRHMCTPKNLVGVHLEHVKEYSNTLPSVPFLIDCDVLVTDFSSILIDGYILGKPSVLVTDGADGFNEAHGLYEEYPTFYGSRAVHAEENEETLLETLRDAFGSGLGKVERRCLESTVGVCDGKSAKRVADLIGELA